MLLNSVQLSGGWWKVDVGNISGNRVIVNGWGLVRSAEHCVLDPCLILPTRTGTGMSRGTNNDNIMFQEWSLLVKLNQRNHRTGNNTLKGRSLSEEVLASRPLLSKDLLCGKIFNSYWCYQVPPPSFPGQQWNTGSQGVGGGLSSIATSLTNIFAR